MIYLTIVIGQPLHVNAASKERMLSTTSLHVTDLHRREQTCFELHTSKKQNGNTVDPDKSSHLIFTVCAVFWFGLLG